MNLEERLFSTVSGPKWEQISVRHHHGICVPLFSLLSEKSCGIGEYLDLIPLIKFCAQAGFDVLQLLPLNDTGLDTSPYNALSAFALSPVYLSMHALPLLEKVPDYQEKLSKIHYWNRTPRVKYHIVREHKFAFLREYFDRTFDTLSQNEDYQRFREKNASWLEPYALFKAIKESEFWKEWQKWPEEIKNPTDYSALLEKYKEKRLFHEYLQYLCFQQMESVKDAAEEKKVFLKGDIPILISKDSADVWKERSLFHLDLSAGAPPDMYTREGQNWGFPLYNWEALEKTHFQWWKERLEVASHLYHLYRIDHVVGFFRMWGIPLDKSAKEGRFYPEDPAAWIPHGKRLMQMMLESSPILPIGEDLGLVPPEVKEALYELGICGTKMMRWERAYDGDEAFLPIESYPPMTMSTVSTHDSDTLQLWWKHYPKEAKLYCTFKGWEYRPFLSLEKHEEMLRDAHHSNSLFHINLLQEYLALFPEMVSPNAHKERINIPGKILDTNWTYRYIPSVETLLASVPLKEKIKAILNPQATPPHP